MENETLLELHDGDLPVEQITNKWYDNFRLSNYGAIITFVGVVRDEDNIDGLSFDIYEPILNSWFNDWQEKRSLFFNKLLKKFKKHSIFEIKSLAWPNSMLH